MLDKYECRHQEHCETVCYMSGVSKTPPPEKTILHDIPCKPWEVVGVELLSINYKMLLCIVDYYSKFPIMKKAEGLSADDLI